MTHLKYLQHRAPAKYAKRTLLPVLTVLTLLTLSACKEPTSVDTPAATPSQQDRAFIDKRLALQAKKPRKEARKAIQQGERYFLCGIGRGSHAPGIAPQLYQVARQHCPTQCLEGVSDAIYGKHHLAYLDTARRYAAQWNKVMLTVCR